MGISAYEASIIIHTGLNYRYKGWGIGAELSGYAPNPFWGNTYDWDFVHLIIYPNINYTFENNPTWYYKISAGGVFPFSKDIDFNKVRMEYDGDGLPCVGFSVGYKF